jgi:ubiquinone/menaquinone biosynthesis C-methylase UbiE
MMRMNFLSSVLNVIMWILLFLAAFFIFVMTVVRLIRHFYQFPIPSIFAPLIDNPIRRKIQSPAVIAHWMGVKEGMTILEIGPGSGTFTFEVAKLVGGGGRVCAVDIQESIVKALSEKVEEKGIKNLDARQASAYDLPYLDRYFDRAFMVTVLGEIPDKRKALLEIKRVLKDNGWLAIGEFLPDPDYPRKSTVTGWCEDSGFELNEQFGNWLHYLLTFEKSQ